jgi:RimJ/RimL family protein N-acetyltransferase
MTAPHEIPIPGPAADFAAMLAAQLPMIETERLRLRPPRLIDFDTWAEIACGPAGADLGGPFTRESAFTDFATVVAMWLLRGHGLWTVEPRGGGDPLGFVLIGFEPGDQDPELGYLFRDAAQGQGFAAEAARAARDHGYGPMGLPKLVSYVAPENAGSIRLAERLGARPGDPLGDGTTVWHHPHDRETRQ